jgi:tRNA1Val (adenine37-N6)-methyltransferase
MEKKVPSKYFEFKEFTIWQGDIGMPLTTDSVLLGAAVDEAETKSVLDIGTGTGILSLMMAQRFKMAQIEAIEIDLDAANQADQNFKNSKFGAQLKVHFIDILQFAKETNREFDLIISNPPYYQDYSLSSSAKKQIARQNISLNYADLALSIAHLSNEKTRVWIIIPFNFRNDLIAQMLKVGFFVYRQLKIKSKVTNDFNRIIFSFSKQSKSLIVEELLIFNDKNEYTNEFKELTKEFYKFIKD